MGKIDIQNVTMLFPGVRALDDVTCSIEQGSVVALCGENGAGKSTLAKIIAGVNPYGHYSGKVLLDGQELCSRTTLDAEKRGVAIVHQELNLVYDMTVAENIFLTRMPRRRTGLINFPKLYAMTEEFLAEVGLNMNPQTKIKDLTMGYRQLVEVAKAISSEPDVLIFDEATSCLSDKEVRQLFQVMQKRRELGCTMIYVSHKLEEIFECCTDIVVLKDGQFVGARKATEIDKDGVVSMMIGRELKDMYPPRPQKPADGQVALEVRGWSMYNQSRRKLVDNVDFEAKAGRILGVYGLVGAGRSELMNSIFQGRAIKTEGELLLYGKPAKIKDSADAISQGIALVTEDRKKTGLILNQSVKSNLVLASLRHYAKAAGLIDEKGEAAATEESIGKLSIKVADVNQKTSQLSGGNQQKVVLGKWLLMKPRILILDEPTVGIDVGTKSEIYKILRGLADSGMTVIMVSSELPEVIGVSDEVYIMREGKMKARLSCEELSEKRMLGYAIGVEETVS